MSDHCTRNWIFFLQCADGWNFHQGVKLENHLKWLKRVRMQTLHQALGPPGYASVWSEIHLEVRRINLDLTWTHPVLDWYIMYKETDRDIQVAFPFLLEQFFVENVFNEHTRELCNCIDVNPVSSFFRSLRKQCDWFSWMRYQCKHIKLLWGYFSDFSSAYFILSGRNSAVLCRDFRTSMYLKLVRHPAPDFAKKNFTYYFTSPEI